MESLTALLFQKLFNFAFSSFHALCFYLIIQPKSIPTIKQTKVYNIRFFFAELCKILIFLGGMGSTKIGQFFPKSSKFIIPPPYKIHIPEPKYPSQNRGVVQRQRLIDKRPFLKNVGMGIMSNSNCYNTCLVTFAKYIA